MGQTNTKVTANSNNTNIQTSYNSTNYNNEVICQAKCENIQSNIYLVIEGSETGNINFNQTCNSELNCITTNEIEFINNTQVSNIQFAESVASAEFGAFPTIGYQDTDLTANSTNYSLQSVYNITNINITKNCNSSSLNVQADIFTIIKDSRTGDINFTQSGNATATCTSTNSAKVSNYNALSNDQTAKSEAKRTAKGLGGIFLIIFALLLIFIFVGMFLVNKVGIPKLGPTGGGGAGGGDNTTIVTQNTDEQNTDKQNPVE